jgi:hypothetical protein
MKMEKENSDLVGKALESGDPMKLGLALVAGNIEQANKLSREIMDADRRKIKELERQLEERDEYIRRFRRRINDFFFGELDPLYEDALDFLVIKD